MCPGEFYLLDPIEPFSLSMPSSEEVLLFITTFLSLYPLQLLSSQVILSRPLFQLIRQAHFKSMSIRFYPCTTAYYPAIMCWPFVDVTLEDAPPPAKPKKVEEKEEEKAEYVLVSDQLAHHPGVSLNFLLIFPIHFSSPSTFVFPQHSLSIPSSSKDFALCVSATLFLPRDRSNLISHSSSQSAFLELAKYRILTP